jgi:orotidine-5'-phosphate decarboxylase
VLVSVSSAPHPARNKLAFALDFPTLEDAERAAERVAPSAGVLKIGLELFVREGPRAILLGQRLAAEIFLDLKLHDIPETVERAVASAAAHGVRYLTIHSAGGPKMLEAAAARAARENSGLTLLAITVLTSLDANDLAAIGVAATPAAQALRLARLAQKEGIPGMVCSASEVGELRRALGASTLLVTPGIRPSPSTGDDQKRTGTPSGAIRDGASLLVVGRPIRDALDPAAAARAIADEIAEAGHASTLV